MDRLISEQDVIDAMAEALKHGEGVHNLLGRILAIPSAEPKTGQWIEKGNLSCRCDQCGCKNNRETKFCPNCGARMVEPQERSKE